MWRDGGDADGNERHADMEADVHRTASLPVLSAT
jgi:hypothetical protein